MKLILAPGLMALGLLCIPLQALATGGLDCTIGDENLDFYYDALFSYSANAPLFQTKGTFESKHPKTYAALKKLDTDHMRLIQQWIEDKDLRLQFYAETEGENVPFASVKLSIQATAGEDEIAYEGTYKFEIVPEVVPGTQSEPIKLTGHVSCSMG